MQIQLKEWKVINMNYTFLESPSREENSFDLESGNFFSDDKDDKSFGVGFKLSIHDKSFDLFVEAIFQFELDDIVTEEFKTSSFPKVNAPAISFPYLRAFVSNLTLQSGIEPVILPSINFIKFTEKK